MSASPVLLGCDFSSSPSPRKPIVLALGHVAQGRVQLRELVRLHTLPDFANWLQQPQAWVGGFDLPFGLPRELVQTLGWPTDWQACMQHYAALSRADIRATFKAFCDARPVGGKFAHRATDIPAGSSPSMKWVNPPVAYMLHAGVPLLMQAGVCVPRLHVPAPVSHPSVERRIALEAYPGLLARELIGNTSYKSDDKAKQTPERLIARKQLLQALELGQTRLGLRLKLTHAQHDTLVDDASGDSLDAVLCMVQAAWAQTQHEAGHPHYGLPACDPLEGWIVTA
ncbi:DUF429 domain-containing protein [Limnohabitans sp. JirII-29]|uniref:DUF429 domain-containing protein n=1 Tax=unclassified Limnohabitans TaxID=2626134 RepID=UPI000C1EB92B|nr:MULTISPECIES: DUF429 domain-containing protein [unclassified Limnohabitans]PIT79146.1 DUF429 domain-containing protein [Limnohabitans sp. JirII-31]PUE25280.1 DUF429 domain-containing protein [Limnohabitans sp. JirII-29]